MMDWALMAYTTMRDVQYAVLQMQSVSVWPESQPTLCANLKTSGLKGNHNK